MFDEAEETPTFIEGDFLEDFRTALAETGFVTDEHPFAPFGAAMSRGVEAIQAALDRDEAGTRLSTGFVADHPTAGYAFFVYDVGRFGNVKEAEASVREWLDRHHGREADDA